LSKLAARVIETYRSAGPTTAFALIEDQGLNSEEKTVLWAQFDSKLRSDLKREGQHRAMKGVPA
jgi:hypothetical protein